MPNQRSDPEVSHVTVPPFKVAVELLVVPIFEEDDLADLPGLDVATGGEITRACSTQEFRPKPGETFLTCLTGEEWRPRRLLLVGAGSSADHQENRLRVAAAVAARSACRHRVEELAFVCRKAPDRLIAGQAVAEGLVLGCFDDRKYKTENDDVPVLRECQIVLTIPGGDALNVTSAVAKGRTIAAAVNLARELANEPANVLTPSVFAERAVQLVRESGASAEVLDETAIGELKMGLLLGVARGSVEPPRVLVMRHEPPGLADGPVLGLVGKGVTFDSGGISIKPADGMDRMKEDMSGGAAVVCAIRAIGQLGVSRRVVGVVPMTENMPGGRATKPGDILTGASGTTVEVVNTDAEGRLILGDALWYARELGATHLVDVATLTGACIVALGTTASGLFGKPTSWIETVQRAGERSGERLWSLPLYEDYRELLRSEMADMLNAGGRAGGACTAASFLETFAGDLPWAHVDIAGTAWNESLNLGHAKGATGVMTRTLVELALDSESW